MRVTDLGAEPILAEIAVDAEAAAAEIGDDFFRSSKGRVCSPVW